MAVAPNSYPFARIAESITLRVASGLDLDPAYVRPVASDRYKVTLAEPQFAYVQFFTPGKPRDPALEYTNAGAGRRARFVGRRVRVYVYTRQGYDTYGADNVALYGSTASATVEGSPDMAGHFLAEERVYDALDDWLPLTDAEEPMCVSPLHVLDASEQPQRKPEDEEGLVRSCLDFEVVYISCVVPTEPPG